MVRRASEWTNTSLSTIVSVLVCCASCFASSGFIICIGVAIRITVSNAGSIIKVCVETVSLRALIDTLVIHAVHESVIGAILHASIIVSFSKHPIRALGFAMLSSRVGEVIWGAVVEAGASRIGASCQEPPLAIGTLLRAEMGQGVSIRGYIGA